MFLNPTTIVATYNAIWCELYTTFAWRKQGALQKIACDKVVPCKSALSKFACTSEG